MAILFPDLAQISELKVPPTEGELHLLNHLNGLIAISNA